MKGEGGLGERGRRLVGNNEKYSRILLSRGRGGGGGCSSFSFLSFYLLFFIRFLFYGKKVVFLLPVLFFISSSKY